MYSHPDEITISFHSSGSETERSCSISKSYKDGSPTWHELTNLYLSFLKAMGYDFTLQDKLLLDSLCDG